MKKRAITALFLAVLTVAMASTAMAAQNDDDETSEVNVTVDSTTALDVKPDQLTYEQVAVGARKETSDNGHGFGEIKVENTGSNPIEDVWMGVDLPSDNPFGEGDVNQHVSTNFLQVQPSNASSLTSIRGDGSTYHYIERVEFFQETSPLVDLGSSFSNNNNISVGRIRAGDDEFYFALGHGGSNNACDSGQLRVANTPTTPNSLGTSDFSNGGDDYTNYSVSSLGDNDDGYGISNESVTLQLSTPDENHSYDVLTKCDGLPASGDGIQQPHILLTKYNVEAGGADNIYSQASDTSNIATTQMWRSAGNDLSPGQSFAVDVAVQVPRGVPNGDITPGTMTIYSTSAN